MRKLAMTAAATILSVSCAAGASERISSRFTSDFSILPPCGDGKYQVQAQIFDRGALLVSPRFTCSEGKSARVVLVHPNMEISVDVSLPEKGAHELVFCSIEVEKKEGRVYAATHTVDELPAVEGCCNECRAQNFTEEEEAVAFVVEEISLEASPTEAEVIWQFNEEEEVIIPASTVQFEEEADELLSPLNWFFASLETDVDLS